MNKLPKVSQLVNGRAGIRPQDLGISSAPPHCSRQPALIEHLLGASSPSRLYGKHEARSQWSIKLCIFQKQIPKGRVARVGHLPKVSMSHTSLEKGNITVIPLPMNEFRSESTFVSTVGS